MTFHPTSDYPLGTRRPDLVSTPGGLPLAEVTLDALRAGEVGAEEIRATPATLRMQAEVALAAGRTQLAESFERAAELADVPDDLLLARKVKVVGHCSAALFPGQPTGSTTPACRSLSRRCEAHFPHPPREFVLPACEPGIWRLAAARLKA